MLTRMAAQTPATSRTPEPNHDAAALALGDFAGAPAAATATAGDQLLASLLSRNPGESIPPAGGMTPISAPLGVYVAMPFKEKIWRNEYVEISSLLPPPLRGDQRADAAVAHSSKRAPGPNTVPHAEYVTIHKTRSVSSSISRLCGRFTGFFKAMPGDITTCSFASKWHTIRPVDGAPSTRSCTCRLQRSAFARIARRLGALRTRAVAMPNKPSPIIRTN